MADPTNPNAEPATPQYQPRPAIACCVHLRTKSMGYRPDERPGRLHESEVMHYWCLKTQFGCGPDDETAFPSLCQPGRNCFQAED